MENGNNSSFKMSKKTWILIVAALVILVAAILLAFNLGQKKAVVEQQAAQQTANQQVTTTTDNSGNKVESVTPTAIKGAVAQIPGANLVTTDNKVINANGVVAVNNAQPMSPEAPKQTTPMAKDQVAKLPNSVIKLTVTAAGWNPNSFTVKAGAPVSVVITSGDSFTHVFAFDDPSLSAVAVGVSPQETRAITFNAPTKAGEYGFLCAVPGHAGRGETGKMIVK